MAKRHLVVRREEGVYDRADNGGISEEKRKDGLGGCEANVACRSSPFDVKTLGQGRSRRDRDRLGWGRRERGSALKVIAVKYGLLAASVQFGRSEG
eukprot:scaffold31923_cov112-Isochrysis_galbana.AAC.1